ncbi:MAG TPA: class 1 fructose-bisphosphatase [bacterium]|nr:class 1 fructose-bisphosphatase [bacterium]
MSRRGITLTRYIIEEQRGHPEATGEFTTLLAQIGLAAKMISRATTRAGLVDILGLTGEMNIHGEQVQKLDQYANQVFVSAFELSGLVSTLASEEMEEPLYLPEGYMQAKYVFLFDPLDGSSNIDVNGTIGSIFSVYRRVTEGVRGNLQDLLRRGSEQIAAGYVIYGSSTVLVYTSGNGVNGFTLDPGIGEFLLSHENLRIPARGNTYSANEGNYHKWHPEMRRFIDYLKAHDPAGGRPYSARYVGSLVADFHRTLLTGGVFLYPGEKADSKNPAGKLRLLYEVAPMAFIAEHAGGRAITGTERILDIVPESLHQRIPVIIGSPEEVSLAEEFVRGLR